MVYVLRCSIKQAIKKETYEDQHWHFLNPFFFFHVALEIIASGLCFIVLLRWESGTSHNLYLTSRNNLHVALGIIAAAFVMSHEFSYQSQAPQSRPLSADRVPYDNDNLHDTG